MKIKSAVAVSTYLPYTMAWIHRQFDPPGFKTETVITQHVENLEVFPHSKILLLPSKPYWKEVIKAKLWFYFGNKNIRLGKKEEKQISYALTEGEINIIHAHFGTYAVYLLDISKRLNIPLIVTFHGFDISSALNRWPAYKAIFPTLLKSIRFAVVISEEMKNRIVAEGCPAEKTRVCYLGVPLQEFPFYDRSKRKGPVTFLHAGRLTGKKGVPDLVRAFCGAFGNSIAAQLWIVGDGEEKELVASTIVKLTAEKNVLMFGRKSNEDLLRIRHEADVFVLNCRTDVAGTKEGLPISTLEAASTGLPAISTYHAGIPESIIDNVSGFLVPEFDNEALANAMRKMMDKQLRLKFGKNARDYMENKFDLQRCNENLSAIYTEALNN